MNSRRRYSRKHAKTRKHRHRAVSKRRVRRTARRRRRTAINHKGGSSMLKSIKSKFADTAGKIKDDKRLLAFGAARIENERNTQGQGALKPSIDEISALFKGGKYIPDIDGLLLSNVVSLRHMILCAIEQTINTYGTGLSEGKTSLLAKELMGIPFSDRKFLKETKLATYYRLAIREAFDLEEVSDSTELIILVDLYNRVNNYISYLRKRIVSLQEPPGETSTYNHVCTILKRTVDTADTRISEDETKLTDTKAVLEQLFDTPGTSETTDGGVVVFMRLNKDRKHSVEKMLLLQYPKNLKEGIQLLKRDKTQLENIRQKYPNPKLNAMGSYMTQKDKLKELDERIKALENLERVSTTSSSGQDVPYVKEYFDNIEKQHKTQMEFFEKYETQNLMEGAFHGMLADAGLESAKLAADIYGTAIESAIASSSAANLIGEAVTKIGIITTGGLLTASSITVKEMMKKLKSFVEKCILNSNSFYESSDSEPYKQRVNQVIFVLKGKSPERINPGRATTSGDFSQGLVESLKSPQTTAQACPHPPSQAGPAPVSVSTGTTPNTRGILSRREVQPPQRTARPRGAVHET